MSARRKLKGKEVKGLKAHCERWMEYIMLRVVIEEFKFYWSNISK